MPAIQATMLKELAKNTFRMKGIILPLDFKGLPPQAPFDGKDQIMPSPEWAMWLFKPASTLKYHVNTAKTISSQFEDFIDNVMDGLARAFAQWQSAAMFTGVIINGGAGIAPPGSLISAMPLTGPFILSQINLSGKSPSYIRHATSVANAIGTAFTAWQTGYSVNLMFPGGMVCSVTMPPSPNIPLPVVAGVSVGDMMMTKASLFGLMVANHGVLGNHTKELFDSIATAFSTLFMQWKATTMITNIMGAGGVAPPPPSPPGPVVMAIGNGGKLV